MCRISKFGMYFIIAVSYFRYIHLVFTPVSIYCASFCTSVILPLLSVCLLRIALACSGVYNFRINAAFQTLVCFYNLFLLMQDFFAIWFMLFWHGYAESVLGFFVTLMNVGIAWLIMFQFEKNLRLKWLSDYRFQNSIESEKRSLAKIKEMISYISLEVLAPQNTIFLHSSALLFNATMRSEFSSEHSEILDVVYNSAIFVNSLLNDILVHGSSDNHEIGLSMEEFELKDFIFNVSRSLSILVRSKGLRFSVIADDRLPLSVVGDEYRIRQVINNYVGNAVKFTPLGGEIIFSVFLDTAYPMTDGRTAVRFSVRDTGIGISDENKTKLFQTYSQINANETQGGKGTGLGLRICQDLIHKHGGNIGVESEVGHGSTFYFVIPFVATKSPNLDDHNVSNPLFSLETVFSTQLSNSSTKESKIVVDRKLRTSSVIFAAAPVKCNHSPPLLAPVGFKPPSPTENGLTTQKLFLVAEDNKFIRSVISRVFNQLNWPFVCVENGQEAFDYVVSNTSGISACIFDMYMPLKNGDEVCRMMRDRGIGLPVIGMTGEESDEVHQLFLSAGASVLLTKPVKRDALREAVESILK